MRRTALLQRLMLLGLTLLLLLTGCARSTDGRYGYKLPQIDDPDPTALIIGLDTSDSIFSYFPLLEVLGQVLPEDLPIRLVAATKTGSYFEWDDLRQVSDWAELSNHLTDQPRGTVNPASLAEYILETYAAPESAPLVMILSPNIEDYQWKNVNTLSGEVGAALKTYTLPRSNTAAQAMTSTIDILQNIGEILHLQTVALTTDSAQNTAFTLPNLGVEQMSFVIQGTPGTLSYKDDDLSDDQDDLLFSFADDSTLSTLAYTVPQPKAGSYTLRETGADSVVWLVIRHSMEMKWTLWPESDEYIRAGQPMYLQGELSRAGARYVLPRDAAFSCELRVNDQTQPLALARTSLPLSLWHTQFTSPTFTLEPGSQYALTFTVEYPDFGVLRFRHNRGYALTMDNLPPYLHAWPVVRWSQSQTGTLTADQFLSDPEGGSITLLSAQGGDHIQASATSDGTLALQASNPILAFEYIAVSAIDQNLRVYADTIPVLYTILPLELLYLLAALLHVLVLWIIALARKTMSVGVFFSSILLGLIWPVQDVCRIVHALFRAIVPTASTRAAKRRRRQTRKRQKAEQKREAEQARQAQQREAEQARQAQQAKVQQRMLQEFKALCAALRQAQEDLREKAQRLRNDLTVYQWAQDARSQPMAAAYFRIHPQGLEALDTFSPDQTARAAQELEAYAEKIGNALAAAAKQEKHLSADVLRTLKRLESGLPEVQHSLSYRITNTDLLQAYLYFHPSAALTPAPVLVKAVGPGQSGVRYLGCGDAPTDGCLHLGDVLMYGAPNQPTQPLSALAASTSEIYLLPVHQKGQDGYLALAAHASFVNLHAVTPAPCTFLCAGTEYQLSGTSIIVAIKPVIR